MLHIIGKLVLTSLLFSIGSFLSSIVSSTINSWNMRLLVSFYTVSIILLYLFLMDRSILVNFPKTYRSLPIKEHAMVIIAVLCYSVVGTLILYTTYKDNSELSKPLNIGIFSSILSLSFVFTFFINIAVNLYQKKPLNINIWQIISLLFIITGVVILSFNK